MKRRRRTGSTSGTGRQLSGFIVTDGVLLLLGLLQGLAVARALGPAQYGVFGIVLGAAALVFALLDPRAVEAATKFLTEMRAAGEPAQALAVAKMTLVLDVLLLSTGLLVMAGVAPVLERFGAEASLWTVLLLSAVVGLAVPLGTARGLLLALGGLPRTAPLQYTSIAVRAVGVVLVLTGPPDLDRVVAVLLGLAAVEYAAGLALALAQIRRSLEGWPWEARLGALRLRARDMARFAGYANASSIVGAAVKQADVLLLGAYAGPVAAGQYRLAKQISVGAASVAGSVQAWLYPRLASSAGAQDEAEYRRLVRRTTLVLGLPLAGLTLAALPVLPYIVRTLVGPEFADAIVPAQVLTAGTAFATAFLVFRPAYLAAGRVQAFLSIVTLTSLFSMIGFTAVAGDYGATGVAVVRTLVVGVAGNLAGALLLVLWLRRGTAMVRRGAPTVEHFGAEAAAGQPSVRETET